MNDEKRESALFDELFDIQYDIVEVLEHLVNAEWDSFTLMKKIEELLKQKSLIDQELYELDGNETQRGTK
jgi:hypothetical protein